jgi:hypothetical protein
MIHKQYEKFKGKICTILTAPTSFPFRDPKQHAEFFTGEVVEVDAYGVKIKNLNNNTFGFFSYPLIGIVEEQTVSKSDPNYQKIKDELEKKEPKKPILSTGGSTTFMPIEEMTKMAKKIKER